MGYGLKDLSALVMCVKKNIIRYNGLV